MGGFGAVLRGLGAFSRSVGESNELERRRRMEEEQRARQVRLDDMVRQRQEEEDARRGIEFEARLRGQGYVPESEAQNDPRLSGRSLDQIVSAATGNMTSGLQDSPSRYEGGPKGYKYDRMSPAARVQRANVARVEREATASPPRSTDWEVNLERGVRTNRATGEVVPLQGLPPAPPKEQTPAQRDIAEQRQFSQSRQLGQDYKANPTVKNAYDLARVAGGIKAGLAGETPMDDLSLIYETVKLFDPNSVVREGEIKLFAQAQSLPLQLQLMVERWNSGRMLTPGMRAHIAGLVDRKLSESERAVRPVQSEFGAQARRYGVERDSSFIAPDPFKGIQRRQMPNPDY